MRKVRVRIGLAALPKEYEPGYPARLTEADFRQLVGAASEGRIRNLLAAAALVAGGTHLSAQETKPAAPKRDRETEVLTILNESLSDSAMNDHWLAQTTFTWKAGAGGGYRLFIPRVPVMYGNSLSGIFDRGEARRLATRLFEAYGVPVEPDVPVATGNGKAVLDGCATDRRIGFKWRLGKLGDRGFYTGPAWSEEPPDEELSDGELAALSAEGYRVHVADALLYPIADGDVVPARLAYVASIVDFLNSVTDGADVDVSGLMTAWEQRLGLNGGRGWPLPPGTSTKTTMGTLEVTLDKPIRLVAEVGGVGTTVGVRERGGFRASGDAGAWRILPKPLTTAGQVTWLRVGARDLDAYPFMPRRPSAPTAMIRLTQRPGAKDEVRIETRLTTIVLPSAFDAAQPFTIELDLPAGKWNLTDTVTIAVVPR